MNEEENKITIAPYSWQETVTPTEEKPRTVEPIEGGISDERFYPTSPDRLRRGVAMAQTVPHILNFLGLIMFKNLLKNWKTTLAGLVALAAMVLPMVGVITVEQSVAITGIATAFGFASAKDGNVTGGTTRQ